MLELRGLSRRFGEVVALDDLSFAVRRGSLCGFLGPNAAGKTTAMRIVMGITRADAGDVRWDGVPVDLPARLRFGYMPEERGLYPRMLVREQLVYLGRLHRVPTAEAGRRADRWLEAVGLTDRADSRVEDLSLGNQQRVQLAAALVHEPELLVLDEPFSGLDPLAVDVMSEVLRDRAAAGAAVLFSSHQLDLVEDICESVAVIADGRALLVGAVAELKAEGRTRLRVGVTGDRRWAEGLSGVEVLHETDGRVLLALDDGTSAADVLARATRAGELTHFSTEQPSLTELFRDAVRTGAAPQVAP
ncbi:MAG: ATP-binding cassette domain-containing protein [Actinobacteria bacterium]|nr:ATP-binding cassette domain-containing protein [Actinomycetota bacterium]